MGHVCFLQRKGAGMKDKLPKLVINDLVLDIPIIQGGMGVRVSKSSLVSAVSSTGALGVIASVGLGDEIKSEQDYIKSSAEALRSEIRKVKDKNLPLGVNIMVALNNFQSLVRVCIDEKVEVITSGAGLPMRLPEYVGDNSSVKLVPIVSSGRAAGIICKIWKKRYNRLPDAFIVEGPLAGGHLGFSLEELNDKNSLEKLLGEVLVVTKEFEKMHSRRLPVIAAGGVFDGKDIAKFLYMGASGVQMSTRFVATHECDVDLAYKEAYLKARKEDIIVILSPVGLPARVIKNKFLEKIIKGEKIKFRCPYQCLKTCAPSEANYCIADILVNASRGDLKNGFAMCGENVYRVNKIVSVKELISELCDEAVKALSKHEKRH